MVLARCQVLSSRPHLQREEAAGKQGELDRVQRAYKHIKAQEQKLESQLSHISEEVKGASCAQALPRHCLLRGHWQRLGDRDAPHYACSYQRLPKIWLQAGTLSLELSDFNQCSVLLFSTH